MRKRGMVAVTRIPFILARSAGLWLLLSLGLHVGLVLWVTREPSRTLRPTVTPIDIELIHSAGPSVVHRHLQARTKTTQPNPHASPSPHTVPSPDVHSSTETASEAGHEVVVDGSDTSEPGGAQIQVYIGQVSSLLESRKVYPREAIDREEEGRVVLEVTLGADGSVLSSKIEQVGPFRSLNQAALQTVERVHRFPPLPSGLAAPIRLRIPLNFEIHSH